MNIAQGVVEFKNNNLGNIMDHKIQEFLDRFYLSRIGIRMLLGNQQI